MAVACVEPSLFPGSNEPDKSTGSALETSRIHQLSPLLQFLLPKSCVTRPKHGSREILSSRESVLFVGILFRDVGRSLAKIKLHRITFIRFSNCNTYLRKGMLSYILILSYNMQRHLVIIILYYFSCIATNCISFFELYQ